MCAVKDLFYCPRCDVALYIDKFFELSITGPSCLQIPRDTASAWLSIVDYA